MKILICGVGGRMGREVAKLALDGVRGATVAAGFDVLPVDTREFPTFTDWNAVDAEIDCIIDFSHHTATEALLNFAITNKIPTVIATTGHTDAEKESILAAAKEIPVFHSANMSLGIALLVELAKTTALLLANAIKEVRKDAKFIFGRGGQAKRESKEIGIHAIRMGNIIGEHEVIVGTDTQTITLKHEAHSRALFAEGALAAADYLCGKEAGLYDMERMISDN